MLVSNLVILRHCYTNNLQTKICDLLVALTVSESAVDDGEDGQYAARAMTNKHQTQWTVLFADTLVWRRR